MHISTRRCCCCPKTASEFWLNQTLDSKQQQSPLQMPFFSSFHCKVWSRFPLVQIHDFRHASAIFQISNVSNIAKKTGGETEPQKSGAKTRQVVEPSRISIEIIELIDIQLFLQLKPKRFFLRITLTLSIASHTSNKSWAPIS